MKRKPRVAVFYGGTSDNRDLSVATGQWVCEHLPRSRYEVIPVHVTANEQWQVPLGSLPASGHIGRVIDMLAGAVPALPRAQALPRLLNREPDLLMTLLRGAGGDDGSIQGLANTVGVAAVGPSPAVCITCADKQASARAIEAIALSPFAISVEQATPTAEAVESVLEQLPPPFFVKPRGTEGSIGVNRVEGASELAAALAAARARGDALVQEAPQGKEITVTVYDDEHGRIHVLPPTEVLPLRSKFFDSLAKRREGRVKLISADPHEATAQQAMEIARAIYLHLQARGALQIDMMAHAGGIDVLEVNTVPVASAHTPLAAQLAAGKVTPGQFVDSVVRRALES
jgi:D-alanine-D-alanine ligase